MKTSVECFLAWQPWYEVSPQSLKHHFVTCATGVLSMNPCYGSLIPTEDRQFGKPVHQQTSSEDEAVPAQTLQEPSPTFLLLTLDHSDSQATQEMAAVSLERIQYNNISLKPHDSSRWESINEVQKLLRVAKHSPGHCPRKHSPWATVHHWYTLHQYAEASVDLTCAIAIRVSHLILGRWAQEWSGCQE